MQILKSIKKAAEKGEKELIKRLDNNEDENLSIDHENKIMLL